jgi:porphobilinogen deaminase
VGKTVREIEQALDERVLLINVESEAELVTIDAVASRHGVVAPIAIRVNPEVTVDSPHAYIKTGEKGQKFGIPRDDVSRLVAMIHELPHVALRGLGMHLGSQIGNADPMRDALPRLLSAIAAARAEGHDIAYMDVGGGLAVPYHADDQDADVDDYAAIVLAAAGLRRLGMVARIAEALEPGMLLPAVGQGAIGIEIRDDDRELHALLGALHDADTARCVLAERALNRALQGGCQVPIAAHATLEGATIRLRALVGTVDGTRILHAGGSGPRDAPEQLGESVAAQLLADGAAAILRELADAEERDAR